MCDHTQRNDSFPIRVWMNVWKNKNYIFGASWFFLFFNDYGLLQIAMIALKACECRGGKCLLQYLFPSLHISFVVQLSIYLLHQMFILFLLLLELRTKFFSYSDKQHFQESKDKSLMKFWKIAEFFYVWFLISKIPSAIPQQIFKVIKEIPPRFKFSKISRYEFNHEKTLIMF